MLYVIFLQKSENFETISEIYYGSISEMHNFSNKILRQRLFPYFLTHSGLLNLYNVDRVLIHSINTRFVEIRQIIHYRITIGHRNLLSSLTIYIFFKVKTQNIRVSYCF